MNQTPHDSTFSAVHPYQPPAVRKTPDGIFRTAWPRSIAVPFICLPVLILMLAAFLFYRQGGIRNLMEATVLALLLLVASCFFLVYLRKAFLFAKKRDLLQARIKLQESENRFKELFENMTSCVTIYEAVDSGRDFVFKAINNATERAERIDRKNVVGKSVFDVYRGVKEYGLYDLLERVWRTGFPEYIPARYYLEDRRRGWKENSAYKLPTGEVVVIYKDVSKRMRAEAALKRSEETFSRVFKANPAAMVICHPDNGLMIDVNSAFEKMTGYPHEELIGRTALELKLWTDPAQWDKILQALTEQETVTDQEIYLTARSGQTITTLYRTQAITLSTGSCLLSTIIDVTQVKQAQEERLLLERQLYESQKMEAIGTLAGGVAHDFNNILGAIIGYAEMASYQSDQKKLRRCSSQILAAADRAKELVMQILTFSRHDEHHQTPMDLRIITKETLKLLRSILPASIDVRCNIENIPFTISGDVTQMHQVIMNVCTNASHAIGEESGMLEVSLTKENLSIEQSRVFHVEPGCYVRLGISDNGCGINPAILDRIFDPFFTTKKQGEGTGLGLSVVYGIVKNHRGHIRVQSQPGEGTTFDIYLPHLEHSASATETAARSPVTGGHERILFVDDETALVDLAKKNLSDLGYRVTPCTNGLDALKMFQSDPDGFDLVITDMSMPQLSGSELSRRIVSIKPDQPIILCTGYSEYFTPEKAASMGIRQYLLKPISRSDLAEAVRKTLDENTGRCAA